MAKRLLVVFVLATVFVNCLAIQCFYRASRSTSTNGTMGSSCTASGSVCYSQISSDASYFASCKTQEFVCSSGSCTTCNTDYCNTLTPSVISCYTRNSSSAYRDDGPIKMCPTGISTCYTQFADGEAGCGICTSTYSRHYGCSTCSTSYCNTLTPSSISCYTRVATASFRTPTTNGSVTPCPTAVSTCYTHKADGEAGCGTCTPTSISAFDCTTCNGSYCNIATESTISCYTRSSTTASSSSGAMSTCPTGVATCFTHKYSEEAGCGNCTSFSNSGYYCDTCNSSFCNNRTNPLKCHYRAGFNEYISVKLACNTATTCHEYSNSSGTLTYYYAGCGSCPPQISNCRTCYTDYCNSATIVGVSVKAAAASAAMLLALMKLF